MITWSRAYRRARTCRQLSTARWISHSTLDRLADPVQSYISTSHNPFLNLSIEHYLLQKSAPDSTILFLPSIIIGRNQNPWLEVNLALLDAGRSGRPDSEPPGLGAVDLVRRRSGGGTVFHDEGNVNWTVICPPQEFTRDKHAEMVVRALRSCGVDRSRVNERHDIVLDQGQPATDMDIAGDTHTTPYTQFKGGAQLRPLKVSGSAYKLTRQRALHHGTALLSSPNLNVIPDYLHSPARPHMSARGVESVSSPVGNIVLSNDDFIGSVRRSFAAMYGTVERFQDVVVGEDWLDHEPVRKGYVELQARLMYPILCSSSYTDYPEQSQDWTFLQTPQFTISTSADPSAIADFKITVRNGALSGGHLCRRATGAEELELSPRSIGRKVHEVESWPDTLGAMFVDSSEVERQGLGSWLETMLPAYSAEPAG
ncbi:hypothetical protein LTR53_010515 [Teratosphaeriaceae sp. CCFEE 6253]|nr:hypothetical protein LTR53_010515 [Teratosphaeriaceae sp. CCFEE 6253]